MHWEPYSIEDAVNAVSEWNYELLQEAEAAVSNIVVGKEIKFLFRYQRILR